MLKKHYSPKTKFIISDNIIQSIKENQYNAGYLIFSKIEISNNNKFIKLSRSENLEEAAQNLYAAMHQLDAMNLDVIIAEKFPESGIGISLNDR